MLYIPNENLHLIFGKDIRNRKSKKRDVIDVKMFLNRNML